MSILTQDQFEALNVGDEITPILYRTEMGDLSPIDLYEALCREKKYSFLLESLEGEEKIARYSILGFDPFLRLESKRDVVIISDGKKATHRRGDPIDVLKRLMSQIRFEKPDYPIRFSGGAVGYFGYDVVRFIESLPDENPDELHIPDCYLIFPRVLVVFDHLQHALITIYHATSGEKDRGQAALRSVEEIVTRLKYEKRIERGETVPVSKETTLRSNLSRKEFEHMVERSKEYILAGDVFQVVLSQRFRTQITCDPNHIYRALRTTNPSPYMYYLRFGELDIVGSSPEIMVRVEDGVVETRPLAGTRPRGDSRETDESLVRDLREDEKERAEHVMLVDLGRNDLGRVCEYGSVRVTELLEIEKYSHVMHFVSNVVGKLRVDKDVFDVLRATFPAGTVSGAPKVRAMEIIDEFEPTRRGIYAGAVGYVSFTGNLDTCIAIRTIVVKNGTAFIQAGAGIVADSIPEREYEETVNKAQALFQAITIAATACESHATHPKGKVP